MSSATNNASTSVVHLSVLYSVFASIRFFIVSTHTFLETLLGRICLA